MKKVNGIDKDVLRLLRMKDLWELNDLPELSLYYLFLKIEESDNGFIIILSGLFNDEYFVERLYVDNEYNCFREYFLYSLHQSYRPFYHLERILTDKKFKKKFLKEIFTDGE